MIKRISFLILTILFFPLMAQSITLPGESPNLPTGNLKVYVGLKGYTDGTWQVRLKLRDNDARQYLAIWPQSQSDLCNNGLANYTPASKDQALVCVFGSYQQAAAWAWTNAHYLAQTLQQGGATVSIAFSKITFEKNGQILPIAMPSQCMGLEDILQSLQSTISMALSSMQSNQSMTSINPPPY